jgi:hypothetical protein
VFVQPFRVNFPAAPKLVYESAADTTLFLLLLLLPLLLPCQCTNAARAQWVQEVAEVLLSIFHVLVCG